MHPTTIVRPSVRDLSAHDLEREAAARVLKPTAWTDADVDRQYAIAAELERRAGSAS